MFRQLSAALGITAMLATACLGQALQAEAAITQAVVYPSSAQLTEQVTQKVNDGTFLFTLPIQADPQSLSLELLTPGMTVADITTEQTAATPGPLVKELKEDIRTKQKEYNGAAALVATQNAQIEFWKSIRMSQQPTAKEAARVAAQIGSNLRTVSQEAFEAQETMQRVKRELDELKKQLKELSGKQSRVWQVSVAVEGNLPSVRRNTSSKNARRIKAQVSYRLSGCGWHPVYRVNAVPGKEKVNLAFDAMIWQSTGDEWHAPLILATLPPRQQLTPPILRPWVIEPRPKVEVFDEAAPRMAMTQAAPAARNYKAAGHIEKRRLSTFAAWHLGKRPIQPGPKQRVRISDVQMQGKFTYLLRPALSGKSFLSTKVQTAEPLDMPMGTALIMLDGAVVAKKNFSFQGMERELFFGNDPQVAVKSKVLEKKSGTSGVFSSNQTYFWKWEVTVRNDKNVPVDITLEEPKPRSADEKIKLETEFSIPPSREKDDVYVWELNIPAGEKKTLIWSVSMKAPKDMDVERGWR